MCQISEKLDFTMSENKTRSGQICTVLYSRIENTDNGVIYKPTKTTIEDTTLFRGKSERSFQSPRNLVRGNNRSSNESVEPFAGPHMLKDEKSAPGVKTQEAIDLNFLAVHSNEYVEKQREKLWKTFAVSNNDFFVRIRKYPNFKRPQLPSSPWKESLFEPNFEREAILSAYDKTFNAFKKTEDLANDCTDLLCNPREDIRRVRWNKSSLLLNNFFEELKTEVDKVPSVESKIVQRDVESMMFTLFEYWQTKYRMFEGFKVLKMGSTYEGTKIGKPDEFDFMIELPALRGILIFEDPFFISDSELRKVRVLDRKFFADIYVHEDEDEEDKRFMQNLWLEILKKISKDLKPRLLPGWTWLNSLFMGWISGTLALTQQILWSGEEYPSLVVDIDICISISQSGGNFTSNIDVNQGLLDIRRPGIAVEDTNLDIKSTNEHMVLRSDGEARLTMAVREMMVWNKSATDNKKTLYRCLKRIVSKYLPKKWNYEFFRMDSLIPSYWIKTILFYMFSYYTFEKHWSIEMLPIRMIEVLLLLEDCIDSKTLSSYFVPHNILKRLKEDRDDVEIAKCLKMLNESLCKLQLEDDTALPSLQSSEIETEGHNLVVLERSLYDSVIEMLYLYGYNEYSGDNMAGLKSFVSVYLLNRVTLEGEGKGLKVRYDGKLVNINEEITIRFEKAETYFDTLSEQEQSGGHVKA